MGRTKGPYNEEYAVGETVRIAERRILEDFVKNWKYHHPLEPGQLEFAGKAAEVKEVSFYHGGDELYILKGVPGIWHEGNLELVK